MPPRGEARQEWRVIDDLSRRIGIAPYIAAAAAHGSRGSGMRISPRRLIDLLLRTGPARRLVRPAPLGPVARRRSRARRTAIVLDDHIATGRARRDACATRDRRVHLRRRGARSARSSGSSARRTAQRPTFRCSLIGLRELRSHNSWMHNSPLLMRGGRTHALRIHPDDAGGGRPRGRRPCARSRRRRARSRCRCIVTDEMTPGTVALPHGWGHRGGWRLANEAGGVNVNQLAPSDPEALERLAGMAHLNGIPVRVEAVAPQRPSAAARRRRRPPELVPA